MTLDAFEHLSAVLHGADMKNFTMTITCRGGVWSVVTTDFGAPEGDEGTSAGSGHTFSDAYNDQMHLVPSRPKE